MLCAASAVQESMAIHDSHSDTDRDISSHNKTPLGLGCQNPRTFTFPDKTTSQHHIERGVGAAATAATICLFLLIRQHQEWCTIDSFSLTFCSNFNNFNLHYTLFLCFLSALNKTGHFFKPPNIKNPQQIVTHSRGIPECLK